LWLSLCAARRLEAFGDKSHNPVSKLDLCGRLEFLPTFRPENLDGIFVAIEAAVITYSVRDDHIQVLFLQLAKRVLANVAGFGGEPN
jgi:hypothetical protein